LTAADVNRQFRADRAAHGALKSAAAEAETRAWVVHDIRRSLVTILAGRPYSLNPFVIDKLLGHSMKLRGSGAVYQRAEFPEERREALETWARILTGKAAPRRGRKAAA
jgi:hypothetical protein